MLYYAKIINEETKECFVPNQFEAKEQGFEELDLEIGYNGKFYLIGYAPQKSVEEKQSEVRGIRNNYLSYYDFTQLPDIPLSNEERQKYADYRQYLREYTDQPNWWEQNPKTFEEWSK